MSVQAPDAPGVVSHAPKAVELAAVEPGPLARVAAVEDHGAIAGVTELRHAAMALGAIERSLAFQHRRREHPLLLVERSALLVGERPLARLDDPLQVIALQPLPGAAVGGALVDVHILIRDLGEAGSASGADESHRVVSLSRVKWRRRRKGGV